MPSVSTSIPSATACPLTAALPSVWSASLHASSASLTSRNAPCSPAISTALLLKINHYKPSEAGGFVFFRGPQRTLTECVWWGEWRQWSHSFLGLPQIWNLWEEEEAQPLHLLQSNLIMDCRFRRSGAVSTVAISLPNATAIYARLSFLLAPFYSAKAHTAQFTRLLRSNRIPLLYPYYTLRLSSFFIFFSFFLRISKNVGIITYCICC